MKNNLEVSIYDKDGIQIIELIGDVTAETGQMVEYAYQNICEAGGTRIILSFNEDNYLNSGGIAFLIGIAAESKGKAQLIRVAGLSGHFHKIFDMMGLTRYMDLFPDLDSATEGFDN
jgi:anti-anti-sigma factor